MKNITICSYSITLSIPFRTRVILPVIRSLSEAEDLFASHMNFATFKHEREDFDQARLLVKFAYTYSAKLDVISLDMKEKVMCFTLTFPNLETLTQFKTDIKSI